MRICNLQVSNYKSYRDSGPIAFGPGFNVIVGQNNAGKTALLEAINVESFVDKPHKQREAGQPKRGGDRSWVHLDIAVSGAELTEILLSAGGQHAIPAPSRNPHWIDEFFSQEEIVFRLAFSRGGGGWQNREKQSIPYAFVVNINESRTGWDIVSFRQETSSIFQAVGEQYRRVTYGFRAERLALGTSRINDGTTLSSNAENLANVVLHLQTRSPARFARLNKYLRQIFPTIYGVSTKLHDGHAHLLIWSIDPHQEYEQLSIDLASSGTGIGQALAILYVVVNSDFPRVLVIDEPNSFLHPAAVRTLLQILKAEKHQYIISTHAAEIVSLSEPSTLHLIRWDGGQSTIESLSAADVKDIRRALLDVGVRLSDVFGANEILWVEGQTEQECFPRLLAFKNKKIPDGLAIVAVRNTGDFEGRRAKSSLVWEIYRRLSAGNALLPPAVAFSFDREDRSEQEIADLQRQSKSVVHFLPRRTYENYLIDVEALAAVISDKASLTVSASAVASWLEKRGADARYEASGVWGDNLHDERWLRDVWGSKILGDLFLDMTNATLEYRKPMHSLLLTEWLLQNKPDHLLPLIEYVSKLVYNSQSYQAMTAEG